MSKLKRDILSLLLFWLLLFGVVAFFHGINTAKAQIEKEQWVKLELVGVYGLRGEKINITSTTNYIGTNIRIYDPNNILIYDQNWQANETKQIPISNTANYGTYRIEARTPDVKTETMFTVLDITGWESIPSFPYVVDHKNLKYTFDRDWTVNVKLHNDEMNIDFSSLRKLAKAYDMNVQTLYNDMNFLIRFTKGTIKIDWNFAFIHSGAKIIINGTLDHARDISINFNAKSLKKSVNGLSSQQIIFDWSDVLGSEWWTYLKDDQELLIHAPKTFRIDPTIFSNGFEEGDFSAWTATVGTPEVVSSPKHCGTYSAEFNASGDVVYKDISVENLSYTQFEIKAPTLAEDNYTLILGIYEKQAWRTLVTFQIKNDGGTYKWGIRWYDGELKDVDLSTEQSPTPGEWYSVEVKTQIETGDNDDGEYRVYIDDVELSDIIKENCDTGPNGAERFRYGSMFSDSALIFHIDCVDIDDEYIGPEISPPPPVKTFDLRVINTTGLGINEVSVKLKNVTANIFDDDTNFTGYIAQQNFTAGNYTLIITKAGYLTYEHDYELTENINWVIKLFTVEEGVLIQNIFFENIVLWLSLILWILFIGLSYYSEDEKRIFGGIGAIIGFVLMIQVMSENFLLSLIIMGISIYLMYVALFKED